MKAHSQAFKMSTDEGEASASGLEGLLSRHRAELLRFLTARCGNQAEAEDLLQDLWIKVSTMSSGPIANGRAYLFRMANNLVLNQARTRQRAMRRDMSWLQAEGQGEDLPEDRPDPTAAADEMIAKRQEEALLEEAIAALPPGAQRALRLYRLEGRGQAEVAEIMGISRSGVEKHLAVAMKHLRNSLADCGWYGPAGSKQQGHSRGRNPRTEN